jgi:peptidyl-prolyl cis-trans isomerase A (cyclophilin A)
MNESPATGIFLCPINTGVNMRFITLLCALLISTTALADDYVYATMKTNKGDIVLKLNEDKAPVSVKNFVRYAEEGFYNGTIYHRVIPDFMIQGGGFTAKMVQKATHEQIKNEADNGLFNNRGTIAMARTADVNSATSQFFINVKNNYFLNNGFRDFGYAVFGEVIKGMDVVDAIAGVETGSQGGMGDVPMEPVVILSVTISDKI